MSLAMKMKPAEAQPGSVWRIEKAKMAEENIILIQPVWRSKPCNEAKASIKMAACEEMAKHAAIMSVMRHSEEIF